MEITVRDDGENGYELGVSHMTKEHYNLTTAMHLPVIMIVTKSDMTPKPVLVETFAGIKSMLKTTPGVVKRVPLLIRTKEQVLTTARSLAQPGNTVTPVFLVSNVTGDGLNLLIEFLNLLPSANWSNKVDGRSEFHIGT